MYCRRMEPRSRPRSTSPTATGSGLPAYAPVMRLIVRPKRRPRSRRRRPADAFHADGRGAKVFAQPRKTRDDRFDEVRHRLEQPHAACDIVIDRMHDRARAEDELRERGNLAAM